MSLAAQSKLSERSSKARASGRGAGSSSDKLDTPEWRTSQSGRGRGTAADRGRGRGMFKKAFAELPRPPPLPRTVSEPPPKDKPPPPLIPTLSKEALDIKPLATKPFPTSPSFPPSSTASDTYPKSPIPKSPKTPDPSATSAKQAAQNNHVHARTKRGRRLKNKESANLKPLSLEDAFASLKCNPFDGEPLKTPLVLTPLPSASSASKQMPTTPSEIAKGVDLKDESDSHVEGQLLTIPAVGPSTSRPTTPTTHIDWADEDDDNSLPDLDDWVTSSTAVVPPGEEEKKDKLDDEDIHEADLRLPSTIDIDSMESQKEDVMTGQETIVVDPVDRTTLNEVDRKLSYHQLHDQPEVPVVKLPGAGEATPQPEREMFPKAVTPKLEVNGEPEPKEEGDDQWGSRFMHRRPNSASPPYQSNHSSYAAQFDRMHSHQRTQSLPHNNRNSHNQTRARPVISAAGLTRISRTLAQAGSNILAVPNSASSI